MNDNWMITINSIKFAKDFCTKLLFYHHYSYKCAIFVDHVFFQQI